MANHKGTPTNYIKLVKISKVLFSLGAARSGDFVMKNGKLVDLIMEDIVGVRKLTKKISSAVEDNDVYRHLGDLDITKLYKMMSNENSFYVIRDLVSLRKEIEDRRIKLKKDVKNHKDGTKKLTKKINQLMETYKSAVKMLRKRYGFKKKSKDDEMNRYPALQKLIKQKKNPFAYYDDDDTFAGIFDDDDEDDEEDDDDYGLDFNDIFDDDEDEDWEEARHTPVRRRSRKSTRRQKEEKEYLFDRPPLSARLDQDLLNDLLEDDYRDADFEDDDEEEDELDDSYDEDDEDDYDEDDEEDNDDEELDEEEIMREFQLALKKDGKLKEGDKFYRPLNENISILDQLSSLIPQPTSDPVGASEIAGLTTVLNNLNKSISIMGDRQEVFAESILTMQKNMDILAKAIHLDADEDDDDDDEYERIINEEEDDDDEDIDLRAIAESSAKARKNPKPAPSENEAAIAMARMFEEVAAKEEMERMQQQASPVFKEADIEEEVVSVSAPISESTETSVVEDIKPTTEVQVEPPVKEMDLDQVINAIRNDFAEADNRTKQAMTEIEVTEPEDSTEKVSEEPVTESVSEEFPKVVYIRGERQLTIQYDDRDFTIESPTIKKAIIGMPVQRAMHIYKRMWTETPPVVNQAEPEPLVKEKEETPAEVVQEILSTPSEPRKEEPPKHIAEYGDPDFIGPPLPPDWPREIARRMEAEDPNFDPYGDDFMSPYEMVMEAARKSREKRGVKTDDFMNDMNDLDDDDDDEDEKPSSTSNTNDEDDDDGDEDFDDEISAIVRKKLVAEVNHKNSKLPPDKSKSSSTV